jgi:hypothetical protein
MLIPLFPHRKKSFIRWRSSMQTMGMFAMRRLLFLIWYSNLRNLLRKWWTGGIIIDTWVSQPIFVSSSFLYTFFLAIKFLIPSVHRINLFSGSEIVRLRKFHSHPRIIFVLLSRPLASSFFFAAIL